MRHKLKLYRHLYRHNVFVTAANQDDRKDLERAKEQLEQQGINIIGVVITKVEISKRKGYYSYYYYYGEDNKKRRKKRK